MSEFISLQLVLGLLVGERRGGLARNCRSKVQARATMLFFPLCGSEDHVPAGPTPAGTWGDKARAPQAAGARGQAGSHCPSGRSCEFHGGVHAQLGTCGAPSGTTSQQRRWPGKGKSMWGKGWPWLAWLQSPEFEDLGLGKGEALGEGAEFPGTSGRSLGMWVERESGKP